MGDMDPALREGYETSRRMQRRHDPTYYFATRRLPAELRPATYALYGYVRTADQIVDGPRRPATPEDRRAALDAWEAELAAGLESREPIVRALTDAGARHRLPLGELRTYMRSMRIDCGPVRIGSWEELLAYMDGSAGSVGRIMAALLGVPARHHGDVGRLGIAFQLANFVRDVGEDTRLDRVYLPAEDRTRFGVLRAGPDGAPREPRGACAAGARGRARPRPVRLRAPGDRRRADLGPPGHPLRHRPLRPHARPRRGDGLRRSGQADGRARVAHPGRRAGGAAMTRRGEGAEVRRGGSAAL